MWEAASKWYAPNSRWGLRGDYRFLMVKSSDVAPSFFGREQSLRSKSVRRANHKNEPLACRRPWRASTGRSNRIRSALARLIDRHGTDSPTARRPCLLIGAPCGGRKRAERTDGDRIDQPRP